MFYAHIILAKKGPLARVWLAAHWDKKITKAHVFETNIEKSVEGIMQPKVKLALRTSGHLLLGVVRIYSRKAKYLLADCNEAFVKIKMAFRPGIVDLPEGHKEANVNAITLPEVFHDFDTALPELNDIDIEAQFSINQSRADEITMREDYGSLSLSLHDEGFGDIGFEGETPDIVRGALDSNLNEHIYESEERRFSETCSNNDNDVGKLSKRLEGENFADELDQPELFEGDLFGDPHMEKNDGKPELSDLEAGKRVDSEIDQFESKGPISPVSSCASFTEPVDTINAEALHREEEPMRCEPTACLPLNKTTLLQNEEESFALAPIDTSQYRGSIKNKRKRKLIVDEVKNISGEEMKAQLANTCDIVTTLDLAPPTKRLMYWKETGGVEKLFSLPSRPISASALFDRYQHHLNSRFTVLEDFICLGPNDLFSLDQIGGEHDFCLVSQKKLARKRKQEGQLTLPARNENNDSAQSVASDHVRLDHLTSEYQESNFESHEDVIFDNIRSPRPLFSVSDMNNDIAYTSGIDDDFNQGNVTPVDLNPGKITSQPTAVGNITPVRNISCDKTPYAFNSPGFENPNDDQLQMANVINDITSDWNELSVPVSVHIQNVYEEQMENETDEQFEERVLNKRAAQLFYAIKTRIIKQDVLGLSQLTAQNYRKQAAQKFYSLLVLKKFRALDIVQTTPYGEINVHRGVMFDNPKL